MKKLYSLYFLVCCFYSNVIFSLSGGMIFYVCKDDPVKPNILFLLVANSKEKSSILQGFDFPSGNVGDQQQDKININEITPLTMLLGAMRNGLEQTAFIPLLCLNPSDMKNIYQFKGIDRNVEAQVTHRFAQFLYDFGFFYLYKSMVNAQLPAFGVNQKILYFFDLTNLVNSYRKKHPLNDVDLPEMIAKECALGLLTSNVTADQFALVSEVELIKVIDKRRDDPNSSTTVIAQNYAEVVSRTSAYAVGEIKNESNKKINLSAACMGMIRDRSLAYNPQKINLQDNVVYYVDTKISSDPARMFPSSMENVIFQLLNWQKQRIARLRSVQNCMDMIKFLQQQPISQMQSQRNPAIKAVEKCIEILDTI